VELRGRWILTLFGALAVLYSVAVLGYVATSPDLRLRALLVDEDGQPEGVQIRALPDAVISVRSPKSPPEPGDTLVRIGDRRTRNFLEFAQFLRDLRNATTPPGGLLNREDDPASLEHNDLPPLVENNGLGQRWIQIEYQSQRDHATNTAWLRIQDEPLSDLLLTFVWLLFQLAICGVASLAWWYRPFDRVARLFFGMSTVTLAAFIGGYHWHTIAGNFLLSLPLILVSALLPAVMLHFFLNFPRPKSFVVMWPRGVVAALYFPPVVAIVGTVYLVSVTRWRAHAAAPEAAAPLIESALAWLRSGVYFYMDLGIAYFALTLLALLDSVLTTRNPIENKQVKGILIAAFFAAALVVGAFSVALTNQVEFALGWKVRLTLFTASISLNLAYAVAIVRHKLMLLDQLVTKGVWYWIVSSALTLAVSLTIAASSLLDQFLRVTLSHQQAFAAAAVLVLAVLLLLWLRDFGQQAIDQRFFREKYQLDRALQQMNQAIGHLGDPESLAQMMLGSCCDVLRVDGAALYLRSSASGPFRLISSRGAARRPLEFSAEDEFLTSLKTEGSLQRIAVSTRAEMTSAQNALRVLEADLVHAMETSHGIDGLVVLGEKLAGGGFTAEDVTYLQALTQITHVALQTARVRYEMARLNEDLQHKSERLTDQGRQIAILQAELTTAAAPPPSPSGEMAVAEAPAFRRDALRGNSPAIIRVLETARKVASSESTVLIRGESGTGKELLAQVLHDNSPRRDGPIVRVHCAALSQGLLESELFGHTKGSFTGAHKDRVGRFEAANGGTLFLDEIGDISLETQIKLLRVLQERTFEPVGSTRTVEVDVRLVTATHQDLEKLIAQGRFREDLYYRLNVISMTLPPLRERREDILELSLYFLGRAAAQQSKRVTHLDEAALGALEGHLWQGNIRELENVIERAVVLADGEQITLRELPPEIGGAKPVWPDRVIEAKPTMASISTAASDYLRSRSESKPSTPGSVPNSVPPKTEGSRPQAGPTRTESAPAPLRTPEPSAAPPAPVSLPPSTPVPIVPTPASLAEEATVERQALLDALRHCNGNKAQAARRLGIPRSTLFSRLKKYGID
jgi:transcriptional regulator with GAF, ATPase, and Fis domain